MTSLTMAHNLRTSESYLKIWLHIWQRSMNLNSDFGMQFWSQGSGFIFPVISACIHAWPAVTKWQIQRVRSRLLHAESRYTIDLVSPRCLWHQLRVLFCRFWAISQRWTESRNQSSLDERNGTLKRETTITFDVLPIIPTTKQIPLQTRKAQTFDANRAAVIYMLAYCSVTLRLRQCLTFSKLHLCLNCQTPSGWVGTYSHTSVQLLRI